MYILVLTRKKPQNIIVIFIIAIALFYGFYQVVAFFAPKAEITLEQRISVILPSSAKIMSVYMKTPNSHAIEAGSFAGIRWNTKIIHQQEMSEISFQYPETMRLDDIKSFGADITIHMNFHNADKKMQGFFQVWKLDQPLKEFLDNSKKYSSMTFLEFKETDIKVQELKGYMWEYVYMNRTEDIVGLEAFLESGSEMYRFSVFIPKKDYRPKYKKIFQRLYKSLRVKASGATQNLSYVCIP